MSYISTTPLQKFIYNPQNFDPRKVLPDDLIKYSDDARYLIFKIFEQKVLNFKSKSDFIPIKCAYIRKVISERNYMHIRDSLIRHQVIETDSQWIRGYKSIGYKISPEYLRQPFKKIAINNPRLIRNITKNENQMFDLIEADVHKFLLNNLKMIKINYQDAVDSLTTNVQENKISIDFINDEQWFFKYDDYGRVHTNITNLKSSLRRYLIVDGEPLVEIDIANSQPLFLSILANSFLLYNKLINTNLPSPPSVRCDILDCQLYKKLVEQGLFYDYLAKYVGLELNRKQLKVKMFSEVLFGRSHGSNLCKQFAKLFPHIFRIIEQVKKKDYTALACMLQRIESSFVINKITRKIMENNTFVTTIHDSFLVKAQDKDFVINCIVDEFAEYDYTPKLMVKSWK